ncbi:hypothetical protein [Novipirellula maiorica]|nr:hypothetical protein [Rhodopirellula maiorica]
MANHLKTVSILGIRKFCLRSLAIGIASFPLTHSALAESPDDSNQVVAETSEFWEAFAQRIEMAPEIQLSEPQLASAPAKAIQSTFPASNPVENIESTPKVPEVGDGAVTPESAVVVFVRPDADPLSLIEQTESDTDVLLGDALLGDALLGDGDRQQRDRSGRDVSPDGSLASELEALMKPIDHIGVGLGDPEKKVPENVAAANVANQWGDTASLVVLATGVSSPLPDRYTAGFCHLPLYFEQANLERCGDHYGVFQNAVSGFEFLYNVKTLPYHLVATPACRCVASPGDCSSCEMMPKQIHAFPAEPKAVIMEAAAIAGFVLLLQ